jgi:hypothetical protein
MKLRDYDQSIDLLDVEVTDIIEHLDGKDPSSDEYRKAAESLKLVQEAKAIEVRNKSEHLAGKVPAWATTLVGSALGVLFGWKVLRVERADGVVSSQAINLWDKVIRKF